MKKFFVLIALMVALFVGGEYIFYEKGFYIKSKKQEATTFVTTEGAHILLKDKEGVFDKWEMKGVDLTSSLPTHLATDFKVDEETYLRWFKWIQEMGANTIRVPFIMDKAFYEALYTYNTHHKEPLYMVQGIVISDYAGNNRFDAYHEGFYEELINQGRCAIDMVHGRKNRVYKGRMKVERYRKNVSPWVLGYTLMVDWREQTVAYTNHQGYSPIYKGEYLQTNEEATPFEALLARVMDEMISYETGKYGSQRLISFLNSPSTDPFEYEMHYAKQLKKYTQIDAQHFIQQPSYQSGLVAFYHLYTLQDEFYKYFSDQQKAVLQPLPNEEMEDLAYEGYTYLLNKYHSMPVVVSYGVSSARGTAEDAPLTEIQQGEALVKSYRDFVQTGMAGVIISTWQDTWGQPTWNTAYATQSRTPQYWHDLQSAHQGKGLLSFEPMNEGVRIYIDGQVQDWEGKTPILTGEGIDVYMQYDAESLYLLLKGKGIQDKMPLYIPIDTLEGIGTTSASDYSVSFSEAADFLLVLDGKEESRLFVQSRYESLRANFSIETTGIDAYTHVMEKDEPIFKPIAITIQNKGLVPPGATGEMIQEPLRLKVVETGKLNYGVNNPNHEAYNSLADFCYGENVIEVRLPWQLLNFSNPALMERHDDYYEHYGVESTFFRKGHIGIGTSGSRIQMKPFTLQPWHNKVHYNQRLKKGYTMVQQEWRGEMD